MATKGNRRTSAGLLGRTVLATGVLAVSGVLAACGGGGDDAEGEASTLETVREQGYINVGFAGEKPYGYMEDGELTGQAPSVHREIWQAVGIDELRGTQVDFGQLIPGLNADRFDAVAAGMFITPERCTQADFSEPVYVAPTALLVPEGNPENLSDFDSVAESDVTLGVLSGAVEGMQATESGVEQNRIVEVASQRDALSALQAGRIDALALTSISLNTLASDNPDADVEVTEAFFPVIDGEEQIGAGAAVFRQEDDDLREAFNEQLAQLRESGRLLEIIEPFGFGPETIPPDDLTTEQLCQES